MADLHEKAVGQRNFVESIAAKIPGFKGYMDKELRRDADKIQREFCANKLLNQKNAVKSALKERRNKNKSLEKKLRTLRGELREVVTFKQELELILREILD